MAKRITTSKSKASAKTASASERPVITDEEIRQRAYEIYLARGARPGNDLADWFQARRELEQELLQPA